MQMRYDEELRAYLKTTGLHASDLIKPKAKRKDSRSGHNFHPAASRAESSLRSPTSQQQQQQAQQQQAQQVVQVAPTSEAWTGQQQYTHAYASGQQLALAAHMGLTGQTLYANSDGTISVDGGNGQVFTLHPQSMQLVSGAGGQVTAVYRCVLSIFCRCKILYFDNFSLPTLFLRGFPVTIKADLFTSSNPAQDGQSGKATPQSDPADPSKSWSWHQPVRQADGSNQLSADGGYHSAASGNDQAATTNGPADDSAAYYGSGDWVQQVKLEAAGSASRANHLQSEVLILRSALSEKTREVQDLTKELAEAYNTIEQYKQAEAGKQSAAAGGESDGIAVSSASV